ncbi:disintegrin and metalloproteinase domain-containing protein 8 [Alligator mississippiensis]|uniref:Disintegrin and metalloproteinase domain-containing protein 8 n=1 Tax=Alligator mississippiensis TaxID=8496 RepID=A0A151MKY6_ALLMI|nr:disintegrin and metalloproteinase domain-containing protein 8 [Alligator mississippiensis]
MVPAAAGGERSETLHIFTGAFANPQDKLAHVDTYERIIPRKLPTTLGKRDLSAQLSTYPNHIVYGIRAEGKDYVLHLEKNKELLGEHYTETYYLENGTEVTEKPDTQDHCFYHGHVQGYSDSVASISACKGLRGFFGTNQAIYLIEPLGENEKMEHAVYKAKHLRMKRATCGDSNITLEYDHEPKIAAPMKLHHWKSDPLQKGPWYVELVLVVDNEEYKKYRDLRTVQNRMKEIVNHVDKLYQPLNLRVALIGLEVWNDRDRITVSPNPDTTLENFLLWRDTHLIKRKKHDNAQLITGIDFQGTTVGLAKKFAMCTRNSGGVNQDHSMNPIGAASTMAHEMGHNLGMSHDEDIDGCRCMAPKTDGGCVMAASVGIIYPKYFSSCSTSDLQTFLSDPRTSCLLNVPKADELYGGPVCGNQFIERGEQCDCGTPKECRDPCCNATTCQLSEGAECAHGECCHQCKVKAAGVLCRTSKNSCDLPEYCTGHEPECPEDVFQENGISCQNGNGYCYNGACPSHLEHCRILWGAAAQVAPDVCFQYNSHQNQYVHCVTESGKKPCLPKDVKCGTLHCMNGNDNPTIGGRFRTLSFGGVTCKTAIADEDDNEMVTNLMVVPTGTKCGEEMVCYAGRCQNLLIYGAKNCSAKCNNHGVCNHKRECHCEPGWAPPYCDRKLSEIVSGRSSIIVAVVLTVVVLLAVLIVGGLVFFKGHGKKYFQKGRVVTNTSTPAGLSNPLFQESYSNGNTGNALQRSGIGRPNLIATTLDLKGSKSVQVPVGPSWPPLEPPALAASAHPRPPVPPAKPTQVKPDPPSRPLPELKSKQFKEGNQPGSTLAGVGTPSSPSLPIPPAKPAALKFQPSQHQPQKGVSPKVALKPPATQR